MMEQTRCPSLHQERCGGGGLKSHWIGWVWQIFIGSGPGLFLKVQPPPMGESFGNRDNNQPQQPMAYNVPASFTPLKIKSSSTRILYPIRSFFYWMIDFFINEKVLRSFHQWSTSGFPKRQFSSLLSAKYQLLTNRSLLNNNKNRMKGLSAFN